MALASISGTSSDPEETEATAKGKSEARDIVPPIVWEVLNLAEDKEKIVAFNDTYSNANLGVVAGDLKLRSHLTAFAHNLKNSNKGNVSYSFSSIQQDDGIEFCYDGSIVRDTTSIPFEINLRLAKGSRVEVKLGTRDPKTETYPTSFSIREKAEFLFDYAIADIKEWNEFMDELIAEEIAREDEESELD